MSQAAIDRAVAEQASWMEDLLVALVEQPTVLGAEEGGQALMARAFADCGLEVESIAMDAAAIRADPRHSPFSWDVAGKRNVVATWRGEGGGVGGGRSVVLNGHVDVVPPASETLWTSPPFVARRDGDWLYGRGAGDMKAGLVAMVGAVKALRDAGISLRGDVTLQSVVEEECTGNGALQCLLAGSGAGADAAVLTEPHHDHFTLAQVGVLWFHVDVRGVPAHAARASTSGFNALDAVHRVLAELRALEAELNAERAGHAWYADHEHPINLNPGILHGGDWASTVPAEATLSCRLALYPGQDPADLQRRVEAAVARVPFGATVRYSGFRCEGCQVDADEPVVRVLGDAYRSVHRAPAALRATTATTDARHFVARGIPAICFGPEAEDIHGIDERVSLPSVGEVARVLARFLVAWCGESNDKGPPVSAAHGGESSHVHR
ncbi:MAG TPA: ArgE/DapE family deacylase [Baekduia sp.]|uniref:ArgE/DapE family deacylase n=1 Tax=Baekduia sp. TaxID=2600305 RepID=UPI002D795889|nr:ArgE/DapE family deacylase [Baekduia sp.]HET6510229.1 ArgE/DapE family deacylase [Baekduia sp.]